MNTLLVKKYYHNYYQQYYQQIIQQAKFNYSPLGKAIKKQIKTIKDEGEKQVEAIQDNKQLVSIDKDNI